MKSWDDKSMLGFAIKQIKINSLVCKRQSKGGKFGGNRMWSEEASERRSFKNWRRKIEWEKTMTIVISVAHLKGNHFLGNLMANQRHTPSKTFSIQEMQKSHILSVFFLFQDLYTFIFILFCSSTSSPWRWFASRLFLLQVRFCTSIILWKTTWRLRALCGDVMFLTTETTKECVSHCSHFSWLVYVSSKCPWFQWKNH